MKKERRSINEVRDKSAELWIKILSIVAALTIPLIGAIGATLIQGQIRTNEELSKMNGFLQTHESRITRNEKDIGEIHVITNGNSMRIYKLEGKK